MDMADASPTFARLLVMHCAIQIRELELWTHLGVTEGERLCEQRLLLTLTLSLKTVKALKTDRLKDTVDYDEIVRVARSAVGKTHRTLEHLAHKVANTLKRKFKLTVVTITARKFAIPGATSTEVKVTLP